MIRNIFKQTSKIVFLSAMLTLMQGCEGGSDSDSEEAEGVSFHNETMQTVTLYTSWAQDIIYDTWVTTTTLAPGEECEKFSPSDTVYYDWEPKSSVNANQVSKNEIVFVDK